MIYLERTITVKKGSSSIDEPVILYKGDKNVEIQFSIKNNPFKTKSGIGVTFGQLIIKRPKAESIFSSVAKLSNSKVLFIITRDMIDELIECGNYDFQIRLFNEDQSSRATLAPIEEGIIIREPICEGDATDSGTTDDSTSTDGEEVEIFDDEGNYNKTIWQSGDLITTQKLNKTEGAIDYLIAESKTHVTEDELNEVLKDVDVDLTGYATEQYVDDALDNIEIPEVDFTGYATEQYVQDRISSGFRIFGDNSGEFYEFTGNEFTDEEFVEEMETNYLVIFKNVRVVYTSGEYETGMFFNGEGLVTITTLQDFYGKRLSISVENDRGYSKTNFTVEDTADGRKLVWDSSQENVFATTEQVNNCVTSASLSSTLNNYATKEEIESAGYVTHIALESKQYATEQFVQDEIAEAQLNGEEVDLSNYVTKDEMIPFRTVADQTITRSGQLSTRFIYGFYLVKNTIIEYDGGQLSLDNELVRVRNYKGETPLGEKTITELYLYGSSSTYKFYAEPLALYLLEVDLSANGLEHCVTKQELDATLGDIESLLGGI